MDIQGGPDRSRKWLDAQERINKLERLIAESDSSLKEWKRLHPISTLIFDIKRDVESLRAEEQIPLRQNWVNLISIIFLAGIVAALLVLLRSHNKKDVYEFMAYVLPIVAGWVAGLGLYARKGVVSAFTYSIILLFAGLIYFLLGQGKMVSFLPVFLVALGSLSLLLWALFPKKNGESNEISPTVRKALMMVLAFYVISFLICWLGRPVNFNWLKF